MNKKILIISTSPRKGGNSEALANEFARGALESGGDVEKVVLYDKEIKFCRGCLACQKTGQCIIADDANEIVKKMLTADAVVFATPIYFYEMCGQMKTLLDRTNPLFPSDYAFRDIYLLASAGDEDPKAIDIAISGLNGWVACFEKAKLKGVVRGIGATYVGDMTKRNKFLKQAYVMGKSA